MDLYGDDEESFIFGKKWWDSTNGDGLYGVVSTFRMNPETFGEKPDDALWFERIRKLTTKYVGFTYYGLTESENPSSAMYSALYSVRALDAVKGDLPVPYGAPPALSVASSPPLAASAPCAGADVDRCLVPDPALSEPAVARTGCDAPGPLLCIVPEGNVAPSQVIALAKDLERQGVKVGILPALTIPAEGVVNRASSRAAYDNLLRMVDTNYGELDSRKEVSFLVVTPLDISAPTGLEFTFFGSAIDDKSRKQRYAAFSTFRLNPVTYGESADDTVWQLRINKLGARAAGRLFFQRMLDEDPASPLFRMLDSLAAIDAMSPDLK